MYTNDQIKFNDEDKKDHNSVGAIVQDKYGRYLVQDHIKHNFITLPIGKSSLDKDPKTELIRELYEECGIKAISLHEIVRETRVDIRDDQTVTMDIILFEVTEWEGTVINKEPDKHRSYSFMTLAEIKEKTNNGQNTSWMTRMFLEELEKEKVLHTK